MSDVSGNIAKTIDHLQAAIKGAPKSFTPENLDIDKKDYTEQEKVSQDLKNDRYRSDTKDRKWLAEWSVTTVSMWLFFVLLILITNHDKLNLSDSVLNVLLGTTTLNVLGLTFIVLRGHFNSSKD